MSKRLHQLWYVEQNNISRVVTQHSDSILSCDLMRWELAREVRQSINWRYWSPGQHVHQLKGQRNVQSVYKQFHSTTVTYSTLGWATQQPLHLNHFQSVVQPFA